MRLKYKFALAFLLSVLCLNADPRPTQEDFNACFEKNKNSIVSVNKHFGVAITKNLIAVPKSEGAPLGEYVKFDPYLQLFLVRSSKELSPVMMADETNEERIKKSTWVGVLNDSNNTVMGHIKSLGQNLGDFDTLSFEYNATGEINTPCCKMIGIAVGADKFIPNRYLKHFVSYDDVYYGDIGVKFLQKEDKFFVGLVDPLGRGKMMMVDDELVSVNGIKPKSLRELNEMVLFAPKGAKLDIIVKRDRQELLFQVPVSGDVKFNQSLDIDAPSSLDLPNLNIMPKSPESLLDDKVLVDYGITVDKNLVVTKVEPKSNAEIFGIKIGDKILGYNKESVSSREELLEKIGDLQNFVLLFSRNDFQFFARVPK